MTLFVDGLPPSFGVGELKSLFAIRKGADGFRGAGMPGLVLAIRLCGKCYSA